MSKKFNQIDTSKLKPINIVFGRVKGQEINFKEKEVASLNDSFFRIGSLIFNLQDTANRFGLKYDNILVLIYLREVVVFNFDVKIIDRTVKLVEYKALGFIIEDFSSPSKTFYRLSEKGIAVVDYFYNSLKNIDGILMENKVIDVDAKTSLKAALFDYFQG